MLFANRANEQLEQQLLASDQVATYRVDVRPYSDFGVEKARDVLLSVPIASKPLSTFQSAAEVEEGMDAKWIYLSCFINLDSYVSVSCAGALVSYCRRRYVFQDTDQQFALATIKMIST